MAKRILTALLPLVILLAGCAGTPQTATVPGVTVAPATATLPLATKPSATATEKAASSTETRTLTEPGCTVSSPKPTAGPTQESLFPSKTSYDFSQGSEDTSITIIEYSDFQ